ncbi:HIT family protein [Arcanobacterium bovis]|uniref:HIT family protein n=1 Tax=Arcanobacterium bovis TaxID=2529275 RepID=A0A4Q9V0C1_9ACTO|nr:HIT family protein [Arcanobacterium bovis]TBW22026.1 HIT family protein [Arcanobacterium bovis]
MSIFSKIIDGELPGRFVFADDVCVAFATIEPVAPGHVLIVPRQEVDKFSDVDPEIFARMANVAQIIGRAQERAFHTERAVVSILGFDVPHTHIHVVPANSHTPGELGKAQAAPAEELDEAMTKLRVALGELGYGEFVPAQMNSLGKS